MRILILTISLLAWSAFGAAIVRGTVSSNTVSQRERLVYTLEVVCQGSGDAPKVEAPAFPAQAPFHAQGPHGPQSSSSTSVRTINGRTSTTVTRTYSYIYWLTPTGTGTLQIPALEVLVDGSIYRTEPISVSVSEAGAAGDPAAGITLEQSCASGGAVPGVPLRLIYTFTFPANRVYRNSIQFGPNLQQLMQDFRLPEGYDWNSGWRVNERLVNGVPCLVYSLETELIPKRAGDFALPPFSMTFSVPVPDADGGRAARRRSPFGNFFDDPFFSRTPTRQLTLYSNELKLHVGELPQEGRPDNFSGIIGQITASASLSHDQVSVGDPIVASISIRGPGAVDDATLPSLKANPAVAECFNLSGEEEPGHRDEATGDLTFQLTLRARKAGELEFPALEIPYYDPADQQYHTARTSAIPVTAAAVRQVTLKDATIAGGAAPAAAPAPAETPESNANGLAADYSVPELLADGTSASGASLRRQLLLFGGLPAAIWLLCLLAKLASLLRGRLPGARAVAAAARQLRHAVRAYRPGDAASADTLYRALHGYAAQRFRLPGGILGAADLERLGLPPPQQEAWRRALEAVDALRFAGSEFTAAELEGIVKELRI